MGTKIITITDFIRNFGSYADELLKVNEIVLTREGRPFATVKASPEEKNRQLLALRASMNPKLWANDKTWKEVAKRRNRPYPIKL